MTWGHGAGTWGGFRRPAWWIALEHQRMRPLGFDLGTAGTRGGFRGPAWWIDYIRAPENETFMV